MTATVSFDHSRGNEITEPGVYDIPPDVYHADPVPGGSLSSTGARQLVPPNCPALFKWNLDHQQTPNNVFDLGHAAHTLVLGDGPEIARIDADDWRSKAAREQRDAAYAAGQVPLLGKDYQRVHAMAEALRQHPVASALLDPSRGAPEQSLFWLDPATSVWRRARLDWMFYPGQGPLIVSDYKTMASVDVDAIQKSVDNFGYHQQAAWYLDGVRDLGLAQDAEFVFICQEKTPPYCVRVVELDSVALRWGRVLNRKAIDVYRRCRATGQWPGHGDNVELITLPGYAQYRHEAAYQRGDYDTEEATQ